MPVPRVSLIVVALFGLPSASFGGTLRYDLPELRGEHRYDGTTHFVRGSHIDTPFYFYSVRQARLVIEGSVQPGKARGDGIIREALEFDLEPVVKASPSFKRKFMLGATPTVGTFSFDEIYPTPFMPVTMPLPNPAGYTPISFSVGLNLWISANNIPPKIDPDSLYLDATDGIVVDAPIIANVTTAYIELSGSGIVPEPSSSAVALVGMVLFLVCKSARFPRLTN